MTASETRLHHNIIVEKHAGGGRRYTHRAVFARIRSPQGRELSALAYITLWGFDALVSHGHAAEGNSPEHALERLCEVNGIEKPVDGLPCGV